MTTVNMHEAKSSLSRLVPAMTHDAKVLHYSDHFIQV